jgi:uncharacterized phage protein gp47/JayE
MPTLPTFADLYASARSEIQARNPALTDFTEGSVLDALTGSAAVLADEVIRIGLDLFAAHFVDTAEGEALDELAQDRFGLSRHAAQAAVGTLTFTRGDAEGGITIPAGTTVEGTVNGRTVSVTTNVIATMAAASNTVSVRATSTVTGPSGNIAAGVLDTVADEVDDDPTLTVTHADRFVGGRVEETDEEFRARIRAYFSTLRKATISALEAGALEVGGVRFATVDEQFIAPEDGGYVLLVVGDPDGRANEALTEAVELELVNWRAAGVEVRVEASEREEVDLAVTVRVKRATDQSALIDSVRAAVLAYTDSLAPGETLYRSRVACAVLDLSEDVVDVVVSDPEDDLQPTEAYNALRVDSADLSITFAEV